MHTTVILITHACFVFQQGIFQIAQRGANKITQGISSLCTVASLLKRNFGAFIKANLTVISEESDSITHLLHLPIPVDYESWVHLIGFIHLTILAKRWRTFLLCCLFPCQRLEPLAQDESSLSASRTHDCTKTKAAWRLSKELTGSAVNYPSTCRLLKWYTPP